VISQGHGVEAVTVEKVFDNENGRTVLYVSGAIGQRSFKGIMIEPTKTIEGDGTTLEQLLSWHLLNTEPPGWEINPPRKQIVVANVSKRAARRATSSPAPSPANSTKPRSELYEKVLAAMNGAPPIVSPLGEPSTNGGTIVVSSGNATSAAPETGTLATRSRPKVLVLGAGLAGLSSAINLASFNFDVTILEARDRPGGRCWAQSVGENDAMVDLGAGWIHGVRGNPLAKTCTDYGLEMSFTGTGQVIPMYDVKSGKLTPAETDTRVEKVFNQALTAASSVGEVDIIADQMVTRYAPWVKNCKQKKRRFPGPGVFLPFTQRYLSDLARWNKVVPEVMQEIAVVMESMLFATECIAEEKAPEQTPLGDYIGVHFDQCMPEASDLERRLFSWHRSNLEYANATDLGSLSAAYWNFDDEHSFPGAHALIKQGYGTLTYHMAHDAQQRGVTIRYDTEVKSIDSVQGIVAGHYGPEQTPFQEQADYIIATFSLGVLKANAVQFSPALPPQKLLAIDKMGFGNLNKVALAFDDCFWDAHFPVLGHVAEVPGEFFLVVNMKPVAQKNVLLLLASGDFGNKLEDMSDQEAVERACKSLQGMFPRVRVPAPKDFKVTRWRKDRFARGSYSYMKAGAYPDLIEYLAAPLDGGKVFFAGEATNMKHIATAHGAFESGQRVCEEVAKQFIQDATPGSSQKSASVPPHEKVTLPPVSYTVPPPTVRASPPNEDFTPQTSSTPIGPSSLDDHMVPAPVPDAIQSDEFFHRPQIDDGINDFGHPFGDYEGEDGFGDVDDLYSGQDLL